MRFHAFRCPAVETLPKRYHFCLKKIIHFDYGIPGAQKCFKPLEGSQKLDVWSIVDMGVVDTGVMFTDVVGFTPLTERLGPDAIGELLNRYLGEIADVAHAHGATVDKFIGDCVMIVFGTPEAMEPQEQARRCVALAQEVHARVSSLGLDPPLEARTGINTGEAVVGNFGSRARSDYTALGAAVNVAARLESASAPGRILIGPETARLLEDLLELEPAGALSLKGVTAPVNAFFVCAGVGDSS